MKKFSGMYYKHQKGKLSFAVIAGTTAQHAFIQIITNKDSYYFKYPALARNVAGNIQIGDNLFSNKGISLDIHESGMSIFGKIQYADLTSPSYDIMGVFRFLPMQCRHTIVSLHHRLHGDLFFNNERLDFNGGIGYIEGDSGSSFPAQYTWLHCNDFPEKACVTVSVATIPFLCAHFRGCIGIVYFQATEYRFATYLGVKTLQCDENGIVLSQKKLRLEIKIAASPGYSLLAPQKGHMNRHIKECLSCTAQFRFYKDDKLVFNKQSTGVSVEHVGKCIMPVSVDKSFFQ